MALASSFGFEGAMGFLLTTSTVMASAATSEPAASSEFLAVVQQKARGSCGQINNNMITS